MADDIFQPASAAPDSQAKLRAIVAGFPGPGYGLVDGGLIDDLPALFKRERLFARSLFLDTADLEVQAAGPWLVRLDQAPDATDKVFALVGDKPAAVFWCCDAGEMVLWRHLRGLNMARIPSWAADGGTEPPSDPAGADASEAVMFRHWDPRVLGALLPALDAAQFSRMLGPAEEIAFVAADFGGVKRVPVDSSWPPAPPGLLAITSAQIEVLNGRRLGASHRHISMYLREVLPEVTKKVGDDELFDFVRRTDARGRNLGLVSETARGRWSYLMLISDGRVARTPRAIEFISHGDAAPDMQIKKMIEMLAGKITAVAHRSSVL